MRILSEQYRLKRSEEALESFTLPMPPSVDALHAYGTIAAIPDIARAAHYGGLVDHIPESDGRLRRVPLVAEFHGRLLPQMGLVLACAAMDVDPHLLRISRDKIVIPMPDGSDISIPTSNQITRFGFGGMFMDVPWFGNGDWHTMYALPGGGHFNIGVLWGSADLRRRRSRPTTASLTTRSRISSNWPMTGDHPRNTKHCP